MSATRSPRCGHRVTSALGQIDELGAAVGGVRPPNQIAHLLQVVDQFRRGGQAQLRAIRQLGEPDAAHPNVAEDLHVRVADVTEPRIGARCGEVVRGTPAAASPVVVRPPAGPTADLLTSPCRPRILR